MFCSLSLPDPFDRRPGEEEFDPEPARRFSEIPAVECHDGIGLPVNGGFQDHLIVRVAQLRPPQKMNRDWRSQSNYRIHKRRSLPFT
jgi:hypothetical protein